MEQILEPITQEHKQILNKSQPRTESSREKSMDKKTNLE